MLALASMERKTKKKVSLLIKIQPITFLISSIPAPICGNLKKRFILTSKICVLPQNVSHETAKKSNFIRSFQLSTEYLPIYRQS
jgi:hypothetical protein